jgi:hypothetical protein
MRDRSRDIDQSREVQSESGYTTGVISSYRSRPYNRSRDVPTLCSFIALNK